MTFLGFRKDLDFLLQGTDIFLFPSVREGAGHGGPGSHGLRRSCDRRRQPGNQGIYPSWRKRAFFVLPEMGRLSQQLSTFSMKIPSSERKWPSEPERTVGDSEKEESRLYMEQVYKIAWKRRRGKWLPNQRSASS